MEAFTTIEVDLAIRHPFGPWVYAVQGDSNTRRVMVTLLENRRPWNPPSDAEASVEYRQPSGAKGLYNLLSDGSPAVQTRGNRIMITLAPQILTEPGNVRAAIVISNKSLDQQTTFPFTIAVQPSPLACGQKAEDYIRLQWLEDKLDEYLEKAKESGAFDGAKGDPFRYENFTPEQLAALTGPQGPAGDSTAAIEAAETANAAADAANRAAESARTAANTVASDVAQLKEDLAGKLPKSPADWEAWTAEEQSAAMSSIGIDKPVELVEEITVTEEGTTVIERTAAPNGDDYKYRRLIVCAESKQNTTAAIVTFKATVDNGEIYSISVNNLINTSDRFAQVEFHITNGVIQGFCTNPSGNATWGSAVQSNANVMCFGMHIQKLRINISGNASIAFAVGSKFTVYGVRV